MKYGFVPDSAQRRNLLGFVFRYFELTAAVCSKGIPEVHQPCYSKKVFSIVVTLDVPEIKYSVTVTTKRRWMLKLCLCRKMLRKTWVEIIINTEVFRHMCTEQSYWCDVLKSGKICSGK